MAKWVIREWDGLNPKVIGTMPGTMGHHQMETLFQRLVCRHLSSAELLAASLSAKAPGRATFLDRVGFNNPISFGIDPHYAANLEGV